MIRADFQQGMELKMNTVTENKWIIYAAATIIWPLVVLLSSHWILSKTSTPIPCPVYCDDIAPLICIQI